MSSLTPLQLQQLMVSGGANPDLLAAYGQQQGIQAPQAMSSDADMLQAEINRQNLQKQKAAQMQEALARHEAEVRRREFANTDIGKAAQPFAPISVAEPAAVPTVQPMAAMPASDQAAAPMTPPSQQEMMAMRMLSGPDYAGGIGDIAGRFASESNAYTKNLRAAADTDAKLIDESVKIKSQRDAELAAVEGKRMASANAAASTMEAAQATEAAVEAKVSKEMGDLYKQYRESADIDPNRFMKNQSTGGAIMSALALAVGGGAAGVLGGPNRAADVLENKINQDIRAQVEKRNGLRDLIAEKREELGDARAKTMSIANMTNLRQAQMMLGYASEYARIEKSAEGTLQGPAAGLMKNELRQRAENLIMGVKQQVADISIKALAHQADAAAQGISAMLKTGGSQILPNQLVAVGPVSTDMAKAVRERMGDYNEVMGHLDTLEKLRADAGKTGRWTGQEKYNAMQTSKALFNAKRRITGSGAALSPMEEKLIKMKDPNEVTIGFFDDVLGEIRAEKGVVKRSLQDQLRANNVTLRENVEKQQLTQGWAPQ